MAVQQDYIGQHMCIDTLQAVGPGKHFLVVEDEFLLALLLEDHLIDLHHECLHAANVADALTLIATERFDGAILDVNLAGETSHQVAVALNERKIPFAFSSGAGNGTIATEFRTRPALGKPYGQHDLQRVLQAMFPKLKAA